MELRLYKNVPTFCWKPTHYQLEFLSENGLIESAANDESVLFSVSIPAVLDYGCSDDNHHEVHEMFQDFEEWQRLGTLLHGHN